MDLFVFIGQSKLPVFNFPLGPHSSMRGRCFLRSPFRRHGGTTYMIDKAYRVAAMVLMNLHKRRGP